MADEHYLYALSGYGSEEFYPMDGATTNPFKLQINEGYEEITATPGDYVLNHTYWDEDPYVLDATYMPLYVYTANNEWKYVGSASDYYLGEGIGCNYFDGSGVDVKLDEGDGSFVEGSTCNRVILSPITGQSTFNKKYGNSNHRYAIYGDPFNPVETISDTITIEVNFGDYCAVNTNNIRIDWWYQYPGVWVKDTYPKLDIPIPDPKYKGHVQLKWTDPQDITDWKPTPATWEGTVIVRKENSAPLHRWDGDKVVRTTTRDKYKSKPYKDEDIETNKVYYYAFMPYYTKIDDPQHPIRYYTFTKCIRVETGTISYIPEIIKIDMDEDVATITYAITLPATGPYDTAKLYGKKDGNPACDNTDDIVLDINQVDDQVIVPDIDGDYFFCIQVANGTDTLTSDVVGCYGENPIPPEYRQYINLINGCNGEGLDFFWKNYSVTGASRLTAIDNPANFSYVRPVGNFKTNEVIINNSFESNTIVASTIITINITKQNDDSYNVNVSDYNISINENCYAYSFQHSHYQAINGSLVASSNYVNNQTFNNYWVMNTFNYRFSDLESAFQMLTKNIRNCNIYVEGILWSKANNES